jgi:hypothetical protein
VSVDFEDISGSDVTLPVFRLDRAQLVANSKDNP